MPAPRPAQAPGSLVDRLAAVVDTETILLSELTRAERLRLVETQAADSTLDYRRRVLWALIDQRLRNRDIERFGPVAVTPEQIETAFQRVVARFPSPAEFAAELARLGITEAEVKVALERQLVVQLFIEERFSPLALVTLAEIEAYHRDELTPRLLASGQSAPPLEDVNDEIRAVLRETRINEHIERWTQALREKATIVVKLPELQTPPPQLT